MAILLGFIFWLGTASIEGTVLRAGSNEPLPEAVVHLTPVGKGHPLTASADGMGKFAFDKLDAGSYRLTADHEGFIRQEYGQASVNSAGKILVIQPDQKLSNLVLRLTHVPTISGYISNPIGELLAAAIVQAYSQRYTTAGKKLTLVKTVLSNDQGEYRLVGLPPGAYYVSAAYGDLLQHPAGITLTPNLAKPDGGYATLYYPGVSTAYEATALTVVAGSDVNNVNIAFKNTPRFTISGRAPVPNADSVDVRLALLPANADVGPGFDYPTHSNPDGSFRIPNVSPGEYVILATVDIAGLRKYSAATRVTVGNEDLENVVVSMTPGADVAGIIRSDDGPAKLNPQGLGVSLMRSDGLPSQRISATADAIGQFFLPQIPPGTYEALVESLPPGTYVAGLRMANGTALPDTLNIGLGFGNGPVKIEVVLSSTGGSVDGMIVDGQGNPVSGVQIVLVPEGRRRPDRYILASTDESGRFQISGIRPSRYTAFAFERIEPGLYYDPDFLRRMSDRGLTLNVQKDGHQTINLHVIHPEDMAATTPDAGIKPAATTPLQDARSRGLGSSDPYARVSFRSDEGTISGLVVKSTLEVIQPLANARVELIDGPTQRIVRTDSGGNFAFKSLPPGTYRIAVTRDGFIRQEYGQRVPNAPYSQIVLNSGQQISDVVFVMQAAPTIAGSARDEYGDVVPNAVIQAVRKGFDPRGKRTLTLVASTLTDDRGQYRLYWLDPGDYLVSAGSPAHSEYAYLQTYFPGFENPADAETIPLRTGHDVHGVDFKIIRGKNVVVEGYLTNTAGVYSGASITLQTPGNVSGIALYSGDVTPDRFEGRFTIAGVTPGTYIVSAFQTALGKQYFGYTREVVRSRKGDDLFGPVRIRLVPAIDVKGRFAVASNTPFNLGNTRVALESVEPVLPSPARVAVGRDGTFTLKDVPQGQYLVTVTGLPENVYIKDGDDVPEIPGAGYKPLQLVLGIDGTEVDGVVLDRSRQPRFGVQVVLVPEGERRLLRNHYRTTTSDPDGRFILRGVPPGNYTAFAWETVEPYAYLNSDFVAEQETAGTKVSIPAGKRLSLQLGMIPAP